MLKRDAGSADGDPRPVRRPATLVALVLAIGLAGAVLALKGREGDPQFVASQQDLLPVSATGLQRLILTTSDPRPGYGGRARAARCARAARGAPAAKGAPGAKSAPGARGAPRASGAPGSSWACVVSYPRPPRVRYRVTVYADRSIYGAGEPEGPVLTGTLITVKGCCVGGP
jgi:hypothetical protein